MSEDSMSTRFFDDRRGRRWLRFGLGLLAIAAVAGCSAVQADGGPDATAIATQIASARQPTG